MSFQSRGVTGILFELMKPQKMSYRIPYIYLNRHFSLGTINNLRINYKADGDFPKVPTLQRQYLIIITISGIYSISEATAVISGGL